MQSKIIINEIVSNKDRNFGSEKAYFPAKIKFKDSEVNALFTKDQINIAIKRATKNPEDIPDNSFWESLFDF